MSVLPPVSQVSSGQPIARTNISSARHFLDLAKKGMAQVKKKFTPQPAIRTLNQNQPSSSQMTQAFIIPTYQAAATSQQIAVQVQSNKFSFIELFTKKFGELNADHSQLTSGKSQEISLTFKGVTVTRTTQETLPTPFGINSDNTADSVANKIADIIYFRYKNVIEELEPDGLETLTNFFISAVGNKYESPELIFNSNDDGILNRKISRCIRALREKVPKKDLKCKTSDRKWTIKGVIFKTPALVNGKLWKPQPYESWHTSSKSEAERCVKYQEHPQIISNEEDAEREFFQRPVEPKVENLAVVSQPSRGITIPSLNKRTKEISLHPVTIIITTASTSIGIFVYLLRSRTSPYQIPAFP